MNDFGMFTDEGNAAVQDALDKLQIQCSNERRTLTTFEVLDVIMPLGTLFAEVTDTVVVETIGEYLLSNKIWEEPQTFLGTQSFAYLTYAWAYLY